MVILSSAITIGLLIEVFSMIIFSSSFFGLTPAPKPPEILESSIFFFSLAMIFQSN